MQICLAIDSSTACPSIALLRGDVVLASSTWDSNRGSTARMLKAVKDLLQIGEITSADITLYAVGLGPGNFTGLRTTLASVRAMALPDHKPVIGISSAAAIAAAVAEQNATARAIIIGDARRNRLWCGVFDISGNLPERQGDFQLINIDEFPATIRPGDLLATPDYAALVKTVADIIPAQTTLLNTAIIPDAARLGRLALALHKSGNTGEPLRPIYMHPPVFVAPRFKR